MRRVYDYFRAILLTAALLAPLGALGCSASGGVRVSDPDNPGHHFSNSTEHNNYQREMRGR